MLKMVAILLLTLSAAACSGPEAGNQPEQAQVTALNDAEIVVPRGDTGNSAAAAGPSMGLTPEGLMLIGSNGSTRQLNFGIAQDDVLRAAETVLGKAGKPALNPDCPAGPLDTVDMPGGLTLFFEGAVFTGWDVDDAEPGRLTTMSGVGIGTTRATMEQSIAIDVEDTSLGHEFRAGALSGLLSAPGASGRVMQLWAGKTCIFR